MIYNDINITVLIAIQIVFAYFDNIGNKERNNKYT